MAAVLLAMLSQHNPNLQTRKGLLLTGLQNDFLSPDGKLPVSNTSAFLDRLKELVPAFREYGDVIWVRSHFQESREINPLESVGDKVIAGTTAQEQHEEAEGDGDDREESPTPLKKARLSKEATDRPVTADDFIDRIETGHPGLTEMHDEDEELFLTDAPKKEPCCIPGSFGAEYATQIKDMVDNKMDIELVKTYYSAFGGTSLLLTLRSKLITELFICGCMTNLSVFATAMDAARYGIQVTLVEDCLGYRTKKRHEMAIKLLQEIVGSDLMTSEEVIKRLENPPLSSEDEDDELTDEDGEDVAVGEDAEAASTDLLQPNSEEDEEDYVPPIVRPSYVTARSLALRHASAKAYGLPEAPSAEREPTPSIEPPKPSSSRTTEPSGNTDDGRDTTSSDSNKHGGYGERETSVKRWISHSTNSAGITSIDDESSRRVTDSNQPWGDLVNERWAEQNRSSRAETGRSTHPGLNAISILCGLNQSTVNDMEASMAEARLNNSLHNRQKLVSTPLFGDGKDDESAGSRIHFDLLPSELAETIFEELNEEVAWQKMHHQTGEVPRLVCCQGTIGDDGSLPVYRHPSDQALPISSWTAAVDKVRKAAEEVVGHELNHALIQLYRGGTDYISEHSDKTLDVVRGSFIVNVSFGALRTMRLRTKRIVKTSAATSGDLESASRTTYRVPMPHNSIITMSLRTNAEYLHGINADKRPSVELTEAEKSFRGQRISLTFRNIGTFLSSDSTRIWGQGALKKTKEEANAVINADVVESEKMIRAFGAENQSSSIEWDVIYGDGFDVLHLK